MSASPACSYQATAAVISCATFAPLGKARGDFEGGDRIAVQRRFPQSLRSDRRRQRRLLARQGTVDRRTDGGRIRRRERRNLPLRRSGLRGCGVRRRRRSHRIRLGSGSSRRPRGQRARRIGGDDIVRSGSGRIVGRIGRSDPFLRFGRCRWRRVARRRHRLSRLRFGGGPRPRQRSLGRLGFARRLGPRRIRLRHRGGPLRRLRARRDAGVAGFDLAADDLERREGDSDGERAGEHGKPARSDAPHHPRRARRRADLILGDRFGRGLARRAPRGGEEIVVVEVVGHGIADARRVPVAFARLRRGCPAAAARSRHQRRIGTRRAGQIGGERSIGVGLQRQVGILVRLVEVGREGFGAAAGRALQQLPRREAAEQSAGRRLA